MTKTKIKSFVSFRKVAAFFALGLLITIKLTGVLSAQSVTKGYGSDQILQRGMIVGLVKADSSKVEASDINHLGNIVGVVVNPNDSPITISDNSKNIFVSTTGQYDVLVSDQNGPIKKSDYITASSLAGIGMKASNLQSEIIGRAVGQFDGKTNVLSTASLTNGSGGQKMVHIVRIRVEIAVDKNPLAKENSGAPALLSQAGRAISGRTVSAARLYLGALVFLIGIVVAGSIIYAGVRSSIIAIGRNPLSKKSIFRSMVGVTASSLIVFLISIIGVYLLLKL